MGVVLWVVLLFGCFWYLKIIILENCVNLGLLRMIFGWCFPRGPIVNFTGNIDVGHVGRGSLGPLWDTKFS